MVLIVFGLELFSTEMLILNGGEKMPDETPLEKLKHANDDLHEVFGEMMQSELYSVEQKAKAGKYMEQIFNALDQLYEAFP